MKELQTMSYAPTYPFQVPPTTPSPSQSSEEMGEEEARPANPPAPQNPDPSARQRRQRYRHRRRRTQPRTADEEAMANDSRVRLINAEERQAVRRARGRGAGHR